MFNLFFCNKSDLYCVYILNHIIMKNCYSTKHQLYAQRKMVRSFSSPIIIANAAGFCKARKPVCAIS